MMSHIINLLLDIFPNKDVAHVLGLFLFFAILICLSWMANVIAKKFILSAVTAIIRKSRTRWDDMLLERHVFTRLSHLAPILIINIVVDLVLPVADYPELINYIHKGVFLYVVFVGLFVVDAFLNGLIDIYNTFEISKTRPIKGYIQVVKIILWIFVILLIIATILNKALSGLVLGLGGLTAVLLFVFKDSILGLVAGIQLSANDMIRLGDWLEMPSRGADGDVVEISLNTVKVRNWDKTITTLPTYALISESFKNWRGMSESGGRRIKRSINLDMSSIRFCDDEMLERLKKIHFLEGYLNQKQIEIEQYNIKNNINLSIAVNGRHLTNIGVFRAYIKAYLKNHPKIHNDMTFIVRQLPSGSTGLPMEIYVFSNDQVWANYEEIQSDIFDHLLAIVSEFDLRVFQNPTGFDLSKLSK